jgi:hypothetical protein
MCECGHVEDEHLDVNADEGQKCLAEYEGYECMCLDFTEAIDGSPS